MDIHLSWNPTTPMQPYPHQCPSIAPLPIPWINYKEIFFFVKDAWWLCLKLSLRFHLNHIPFSHMFRFMYAFLKQRNMKNIMSFSASRQCKYTCNWPYFLSTSKGPQHLGDILAQLPSFRELFFSLTLR